MATKEKFTPEQCEFLHSTPKYLASAIHWKPDGQAVRFKAMVLTVSDGIGLDLHGYCCHSPRYNRVTWGFNLSFGKNLIRQYDRGKKHKNPSGGGKVTGPHKHKFSESNIARYAYKPDPPISDTDPNQALLDFLIEENIRVPEDYQHFMFKI